MITTAHLSATFLLTISLLAPDPPRTVWLHFYSASTNRDVYRAYNRTTGEFVRRATISASPLRFDGEQRSVGRSSIYATAQGAIAAAAKSGSEGADSLVFGRADNSGAQLVVPLEVAFDPAGSAIQLAAPPGGSGDVPAGFEETRLHSVQDLELLVRHDSTVLAVFSARGEGALARQQIYTVVVSQDLSHVIDVVRHGDGRIVDACLQSGRDLFILAGYFRKMRLVLAPFGEKSETLLAFPNHHGSGTAALLVRNEGTCWLVASETLGRPDLVVGAARPPLFSEASYPISEPTTDGNRLCALPIAGIPRPAILFGEGHLGELQRDGLVVIDGDQVESPASYVYVPRDENQVEEPLRLAPLAFTAASTGCPFAPPD